MKHTASLVVLLLLICSSNAQIVNYDSLKTVFPKEDAIVLSNDVNIEYMLDDDQQLKAKSTSTEKILVLKNNLSEFQSIEIPFSKFETVNYLSGKIFAINAKGEKKLVENLKIRNAVDKDYYIKNIFYNDLKLKSISTTSEVKERYIIEYSYETIYEDIKFLNTFFPYKHLPTLDFSISATIPKNVSTEIIPVNPPPSMTKSNETVDGNSILSYRIKQLSIPKNTYFQAPYAYVIPHFIIITKSFTDNKKNVIKVIESAKELYEWYSSLIKELSPDKNYLKKLSEEITNGATSNEQKAAAIFNWVKTNISYVAFEDGIAGFKPEEAQTVEKKRFGDCKGMANLLTELLVAQGLDAHHCWIGTNSLPYSYATPSLCVDNHMICALFLNGNTYLLDATGPTNDWNKYPYYIEGKEALIAQGNNYKIFNVPVSNSTENICTLDYTLDITKPEKPLIEGNIKLTGTLLKIYKSVFDGSDIDGKKKFPNRIISNLFNSTIIPLNASATFSEAELLISFKADGLPLVTKNGNTVQITQAEFEYFPLTFLQKSKNTPLFLEFPYTYKINTLISGNAKLLTPVAYSKSNEISVINKKTSVVGNEIKDEFSVQITKPIILEKNFGDWNEIISDYYNQYGIITVSK
ncbi:MAG: transglutaminase domain-containing protein [Chitinophagales bacterium]|nr:transglutaminase domain-containing protein [Chitinophagales bacterium]